MKRNKIYWLIQMAIVLSIVGVLNYLSLFGHWFISVRNITHQAMWDPGAAYLASGITFFDERYPSFIGHPGLSLMLIIHVLGKVYYWACSLNPSVSYDSFIAKNLYHFIFIVKMMIACLHLLSFYVLYKVARRVTESSLKAKLAVIAYTSSYPVLFYLNNISVEPLLVLFTLLSFYCLWRYFDIVGKQGDYFYLIAVALMSAAAFYTKILIAAPLPLFLLIYTGVEYWRNSTVSSKQKTYGVCLFVFCLTGFLVVGGYKLDWDSFFKFWFYYAPGNPLYDSGHNWGVNLVHSIAGITYKMFLSIVPLLKPAYWWPTVSSKVGLYTLAEGIFWISSLFGFFWYLKSDIRTKKEVLWVSLFLVIILPVILSKGLAGWHYHFIHLAWASVFCGFAIFETVKKVMRISNEKKLFAVAVAGIVVIHALGITFFVDLKKNDIKEYQRWKPYHSALGKIGYNERVGIYDLYPGFLGDTTGRVMNFTLVNSRFYKSLNDFFFFTQDTIPAQELKEHNVKIIVLPYKP